VSAAQHAFFLPVAAPAASGTRAIGHRFCILHPHAGDSPRGCVVYVHPFAEEMNKARRMAALQSQALAAAGFSVLQIDLHGCGDSSGDFGDATWQGWADDVRQAVTWLRGRDANHAAAPLWLWGLRAGCLLAVQASIGLEVPSNFCFWQPSLNGKTLLQQFLRLKLAANLFGGGGSELMTAMRAAIDQGQSVEVAGYEVSADLATGLENARLTPPESRPGPTPRLEWFEISTRVDAEASPASAQSLKQWSDAGMTTGFRVVQGAPFWQTAEIEEVPALIERTVAALQETEPLE
jgi:exosortase A-associated hydrolase 2